MDIIKLFETTWWEVATQGIKLVVPIISIWLIFKMIRDLVLGGK